MRWLSSRRRLHCMEVGRLVQHYLDGEIDERRAPLVAAHLEDCRRCGMSATTYRRIKESLARSAQPLPEDTVDRLRAFTEWLAVGGAPFLG